MKKENFVIVIIIFLVSNTLFSETTIQDDLKNYLNGNKIKYSTTGHPKSYGLTIQVEIPTSWNQKEGERPHIVQKFSSSSGSGKAKVSTIMILPVPSEFNELNNEDIVNVLFNPELVEDTLPDSSQLLLAKPTEYDGESGILLYYVTQNSRTGVDFLSTIVLHKFLYKKHIISFSINYSILINSNTKEISQEESDAFVNLAIQMGNSIIILDKYEKY